MNKELVKPEEKKPEGRPLVVRSELNLEQKSIFTVSTYQGLSRELTFKEKLPTGEEIEQKVIIGKTVDGLETGVLTTNDFKVYLALLELWQKAGRPINEPVNFTILRLMKILKLTDSGSEYEQIKKWLLHLRQIPIMFQNSFFMKETGSYRTIEPFTVLSYLKIYEREYSTKTGKEKTRGYGAFKFADEILKSLVNDYTHPLRLDIVRDFKKHKDTAILLYVYLDRCLAFKEKYEINLEKLFEHLDLSQKQIRYPSDRKAKIMPVLKELENKPLSTGILSYCRIHKTEDGRGYKLVARKKPFDDLPPPRQQTKITFEEKITSQTPLTPLMVQLMEKGLTENQVHEIFNILDEETIKKQLEILPYRLSWNKEQGRETQNPAALFYMALKGNWDPPPNYYQALKEAEEQKTRAKRQEEENLKKQAEIRREYKAKARAIRLLTYYQSLTDEKKQEIDQRAKDNLNPFVKELIQDILKNGKDPLIESPIYRINFEQERLKILAEERRQHKNG
ncbi:MAG: hypothetical protein RMJ65_06740 [candidate division WOR-3 bacterium]|nr:hypothetical protein [candidate division WOR-3 bacterium]